MSFKYWEWEAGALKDKPVSVKHVAEFFFDNETEAYRFSRALLLTKEAGLLRLRDCPKDLPVSTWKRYLDFGVNAGLLQHENQAYSLANRFAPAVKNFSQYASKWIQEGKKGENLKELFPNAKKGLEKPRRTKT